MRFLLRINRVIDGHEDGDGTCEYTALGQGFFFGYKHHCFEGLCQSHGSNLTRWTGSIYGALYHGTDIIVLIFQGLENSNMYRFPCKYLQSYPVDDILLGNNLESLSYTGRYGIVKRRDQGLTVIAFFPLGCSCRFSLRIRVGTDHTNKGFPVILKSVVNISISNLLQKKTCIVKGVAPDGLDLDVSGSSRVGLLFTGFFFRWHVFLVQKRRREERMDFIIEEGV